MIRAQVVRRNDLRGKFALMHIPDKCKEAIGVALYPALCNIFFSVSIAHMSVDLRCTVCILGEPFTSAYTQLTNSSC